MTIDLPTQRIGAATPPVTKTPILAVAKLALSCFVLLATLTQPTLAQAQNTANSNNKPAKKTNASAAAKTQTQQQAAVKKTSGNTKTKAAPNKQPQQTRSKKPRADPLLGTPADVKNFAQTVAQRNQLPLPWVLQNLSQARQVQAVRDLIMPAPAGSAKNWQAYRSRFVDANRVAAGAVFWRSNQGWLEQAEQRYGVPASIVVGIVGVETYYGRVMGNYRVIDALATLSFHFPTGRSDRSDFFKEELEAFLVMSHREKRSPLSFKGSFAGAMGLPQFMPSSVNKHAVDFDNDGHIQLHDHSADVVGSVAAYLADYGWQRQMPTHYDVTPPSDTIQLAQLLAPDITPSFSVAQLLASGAQLADKALQHSGPLALVMLENGGETPTYIAGTQNFFVLTRYNRSSYYALGVIELGQAVAQVVQGK